MDPFTLGLVGLSAFGGTLTLIGWLEKQGFTINHTLVNLVLETGKFGSLWYLLKMMIATFL